MSDSGIPTERFLLLTGKPLFSFEYVEVSLIQLFSFSDFQSEESH